MMESVAIYAELAKIFADTFERSDITLSPDLSAKDVKGWDSFKQIEILIATEARFGLKFTSAEIDSMRALGDLVTVVEQRGSVTV